MLCESRRCRPALPVLNGPYGLCGRKAALNSGGTRAQVLCESRGGRPGLPVPNSPYGFCGRIASLNLRRTAELKGCLKFEEAALGSPSLTVSTVSVQH